jgi:hypothetical protein
VVGVGLLLLAGTLQAAEVSLHAAYAAVTRKAS